MVLFEVGTYPPQHGVGWVEPANVVFGSCAMRGARLLTVGTRFSPSSWSDDLGSSTGLPDSYAASGCGMLADQRNSSPELHIAWSTTASLRATATLARPKPLRLAIRRDPMP